jgi:hypothetical protein
MKYTPTPTTMTHYKSDDDIIEVIITNEDDRSPRHPALMTILKLLPRDHTRCRSQWGGITVMFKFAELRALAEAIAVCDPNFTFSMSKSAQNKPESRRLKWVKRNEQRVSKKRHYAHR